MKLLSLVNSVENIIIYGAGDFGNIVSRWIQGYMEFAEKNIWVAVTKCDIDGKTLNSFPVVEIEKLSDLADKSLIIVAVSGEKQAEVKKTLNQLKFYFQYSITQQLYMFMKRQVENTDRIKEIQMKVQREIDYAEELLWGLNFDRIIKASEWCKKQDITSGGAAVGYYYLYLIYKILNSGKFGQILDIGMGQTSKLIGQYAKYNPSVCHTIIEGDKEWIDFCSKDLQLGENTSIVQMNYKMIEKNGCTVRVFESFKNKLYGKKFDFISVDAPAGSDMTEYSRIDILDLLPNCLSRSWIIMVDDTERTGENKTVENILNILEKSDIKYNIGRYMGKKEFSIIASWDNRFFCTL